MNGNRDSDNVYKQLAQRYVAADGERLDAERRALDAKGPRVTPRLDAMVDAGTAPPKRRWARGLIAACLVAALLLPQIVRVITHIDFVAPGPSATAPSPIAPDGDSDIGGVFDRIPLGAELPSGFSVTGVEQDRERTIYTIDDRFGDPVVAALQYSHADLDYRAVMQRVVIGDSVVYVHSDPDYKLMAFEKDGVYYELSCRHDINTLVRVAESLL